MATTVTKTSGQAPTSDVTPQEALEIRSSVASAEQAPSQQQQASFANWRQAADQLGDPYSVENIPLSKLRMMRRDPMIGFGMSFIKTPHIRAKWYINANDKNGPNAQVAAHLDYDLRRIMSSLVLQYCNSLDFGFQAIAKRFEFGTPAGTFIAQDPSGKPIEQPIWSNGAIQPIRWKPFVALPPETVEPIWNPVDGSFNGIDYDGSLASKSGAAAAAPAGTGASQNSSTPDKFQIDLPHSLWVTNDKDPNFGSIFGYPRLGYAYRYWWSYWFRWAIADRAFEKKADPSILIYHPEGEFIDPSTGINTAYSDYALNMGYRMRSGGVITLPSTPYEGPNGPTSIREWEIDFTQDMVNFDPFDNSFEYLDVGKIRSLWIPEQSLIEGKGGTSSRNVAAEMDSSFTESQAVLSVQIQDTINRWVIPQWLAVNYPDFLANNGTAEQVVQGFADEDVSFTQQVIQLIGMQLPGVNKLMSLIDLQKVLDDAGVPLMSIQDQQTEAARLQAEEAAISMPAPVTPKGGRGGTVGVIPTPGGDGNGNGNGTSPGGAPGVPAPSQTGFTYVQPREVIYLSSSDGERPKISIQRVPDREDGVLARFDPEQQTVYLADSATYEQEQEYLTEIGKALVKV